MNLLIKRTHGSVLEYNDWMVWIFTCAFVIGLGRSHFSVKGLIQILWLVCFLACSCDWLWRKPFPCHSIHLDIWRARKNALAPSPLWRSHLDAKSFYWFREEASRVAVLIRGLWLVGLRFLGAVIGSKRKTFERPILCYSIYNNCWSTCGIKEHMVFLCLFLYSLPGVVLMSSLPSSDLHALIKNSFAVVNSSKSEGMAITLIEVRLLHFSPAK